MEQRITSYTSMHVVISLSLSLLQIQNIQLEREMALASNRSLAEQNLDMKPRLESQKEALVARYSQLEAVRETYRQHCSLRGNDKNEQSQRGMKHTNIHYIQIFSTTHQEIIQN